MRDGWDAETARQEADRQWQEQQRVGYDKVLTITDPDTGRTYTTTVHIEGTQEIAERRQKEIAGGYYVIGENGQPQWIRGTQEQEKWIQDRRDALVREGWTHDLAIETSRQAHQRALQTERLIEEATQRDLDRASREKLANWSLEMSKAELRAQNWRFAQDLMAQNKWRELDHQIRSGQLQLSTKEQNFNEWYRGQTLDVDRLRIEAQKEIARLDNEAAMELAKYRVDQDRINAAIAAGGAVIGNVLGEVLGDRGLVGAGGDLLRRLFGGGSGGDGYNVRRNPAGGSGWQVLDAAGSVIFTSDTQPFVTTTPDGKTWIGQTGEDGGIRWTDAGTLATGGLGAGGAGGAGAGLGGAGAGAGGAGAGLGGAGAGAGGAGAGLGGAGAGAGGAGAGGGAEPGRAVQVQQAPVA